MVVAYKLDCGNGMPCGDGLIFCHGARVYTGAMSQITVISGAERRRVWKGQQKL